MLERGIRRSGAKRIESIAREYLQNARRWRPIVFTMLRIQPGTIEVNFSSSSTEEFDGWVLRWLLVALLLGGLPVLLHGCHGDEDNELFAPLLVRQR